MSEPLVGAPLLRLREVYKSFGAVQALKGVSFELLRGEVHALVGENGAGKSTLVKLLTGALRPDAGEVEILGKCVNHLTPGRAHQLGVACIYQQPALFRHLTVAENLRLRLQPGRAWRRVSWSDSHRRARDLLQRVGANISPDAEVEQLSMPEQQLVEVVCAVASGARAIIMDEPTASLTQREQQLLFSVVRSLRQNGTGVLYITHRLEEVFALSDRTTVLRDGQSLGTSPTSELNEATLIQQMVGRELSHAGFAASKALDKIALSLQHLGCAASGVSEINLDLRAGEVLGLAGLVGAGRTELARVLFGLTPANTGRIELDGKEVTITSPAKAIANGMAYLPEDRRHHGVILEMSIAQNISMAIQERLFPGGWLRPKREEELASKQIAALRIKADGPDAPANSLSGGNQQKVALARWLVTQPKVLMLDEPTQGVDVGTKAEIHRIIRDLAQRGLAVLLVSSDLPELLALSDRIGVMRGGKLLTILPSGADAQIVMAWALGQTAPLTTG